MSKTFDMMEFAVRDDDVGCVMSHVQRMTEIILKLK